MAAKTKFYHLGIHLFHSQTLYLVFLIGWHCGEKFFLDCGLVKLCIAWSPREESDWLIILNGENTAQLSIRGISMHFDSIFQRIFQQALCILFIYLKISASSSFHFYSVFKFSIHLYQRGYYTKLLHPHFPLVLEHNYYISQFSSSGCSANIYDTFYTGYTPTWALKSYLMAHIKWCTGKLDIKTRSSQFVGSCWI